MAAITWVRRLFLAVALCTSASPQALITTVAGTDFVFHGDGQPALNAPMGEITGVTVDPAGNLYFVDIDNYMVMKVTSDGTLHVIAGNGIAGFSARFLGQRKSKEQSRSASVPTWCCWKPTR